MVDGRKEELPLEAWLLAQLKGNAELKQNADDLSAKILEALNNRGFSEAELREMPLAELLQQSHNCLKNAVYEVILTFLDHELGLDQRASEGYNNRHKLLMQSVITPLDELSKKVGEETWSHFIWAGPPKEGLELIGLRTLHEARPDQPIKLWVLDEFVEHYQSLFSGNTRIRIEPIETYAQKTAISFKDKKTLADQIKFFRDRAKSKIHRLNSTEDIDTKALKISATRDFVTIVDYIKTTIPLYEGGWIFDCNMVFAAGADKRTRLPASPKWCFPYSAALRQRDVWFFSCPVVLPWQRDKRDGISVLPSDATMLGSEIHLSLYHYYLCRTEKVHPYEKDPKYYSGELAAAVLQLTSDIVNSLMPIWTVAVTVLEDEFVRRYDAPEVDWDKATRDRYHEAVGKMRNFLDEERNATTEVTCTVVDRIQRIYKPNIAGVECYKFFESSHTPRKSILNKLQIQLSYVNDISTFKTLLVLYHKHELLDVFQSFYVPMGHPPEQQKFNMIFFLLIYRNDCQKVSLILNTLSLEHLKEALQKTIVLISPDHVENNVSNRVEWTLFDLLQLPQYKEVEVPDRAALVVTDSTDLVGSDSPSNEDHRLPLLQEALLAYSKEIRNQGAQFFGPSTNSLDLIAKLRKIVDKTEPISDLSGILNEAKLNPNESRLAQILKEMGLIDKKGKAQLPPASSKLEGQESKPEGPS